MSLNGTRLLTLDDAAAQLAVSTRTVRRLVRSGKLRSIRVGQQIRIEPAALELYLVQHQNKPEPTAPQAR